MWESTERVRAWVRVRVRVRARGRVRVRVRERVRVRVRRYREGEGEGKGEGARWGRVGREVSEGVERHRRGEREICGLPGQA